MVSEVEHFKMESVFLKVNTITREKNLKNHIGEIFFRRIQQSVPLYFRRVFYRNNFIECIMHVKTNDLYEQWIN
jgi:hypothetical protein